VRYKFWSLWLSTLLIFILSASVNAADRWRLLSIPLDMPMDDQFALDGQALEGLYQGDYGTKMPHNYGGYIGPNLKASGLNEVPFYHIDSTLKDGRTFELWFSTAEDGRKVFGVRLNIPYSDKRKDLVSDTIKEVETAYGKSDLEFSPAGITAQKIIVIANRTLPKEKCDSIVARLPKAEQLGQKDADSFWNADLRQLARMLGPEFRGVILVLNANAKTGRFVSGTVQLIDLERARTVFNLEQSR
jgi:hypothetical protein